MKYPGSKAQIMQYIYELIPPHKCWVDVFGGSAVVTLNKKPSKVEVYNDIDDTLVNLMRILANENDFNEFEKRIKYLLYARTEFNKYKEKYQKNDYINDIDKAITRWYLGNISFHGGLISYGQSSLKPSQIIRYNNIKKNLMKIHHRLNNIFIENLDYTQLIKLYDNNQTLFYCDPPYLMETRGRKGKGTKMYENEMTNADHIQFLETITKIKGKAIISGYDSELYNDYLSNWNKREIETISCNANLRYAVNKKRFHIIECLWYNYEHNTNFINYNNLENNNDK